MRKTTPYGRKLAIRRRKEVEANIRAQILADVRSLALDASIHAWTGDAPQPMINKAGRLLYMVAFAADQAGIDAEHPDMRILRGTAGALEAFAEDQQHIERYRQSLQSGLAAINRLLPHCTDIQLLLGAAALENKLDLMAGKSTAQVRVEIGAFAWSAKGHVHQLGVV